MCCAGAGCQEICSDCDVSGAQRTPSGGELGTVFNQNNEIRLEWETGTRPELTVFERLSGGRLGQRARADLVEGLHDDCVPSELGEVDQQQLAGSVLPVAGDRGEVVVVGVGGRRDLVADVVALNVAVAQLGQRRHPSQENLGRRERARGQVQRGAGRPLGLGFDHQLLARNALAGRALGDDAENVFGGRLQALDERRVLRRIRNIDFAPTVARLRVLDDVFRDLGRVPGTRLPLQAHRTWRNHDSGEHGRRLRRLLNLQLHELLIVPEHVGRLAEIGPAVAAVDVYYLRLGQNALRRHFLFGGDSKGLNFCSTQSHTPNKIIPFRVSDFVVPFFLFSRDGPRTLSESSYYL